MKRFSILDIRGPGVPAGRNRRRAGIDSTDAVLDACQLSDCTLPANAASPCGFLSRPY